MNLRGHYLYLQYLVRHKWYVFIECLRLGLIWRGITHDLSKFRVSEWSPYVNYFYPKQKKVERRDSSGYYKPTDTGDPAFNFAWLLHQKRNNHHFQWWILVEDEGRTKVLPMSNIARKEMLADWRGAGRAQGFGNNTHRWYVKNHRKMQLHPETREWVEEILGLLTEPIHPFDAADEKSWRRAAPGSKCSRCGFEYVDHPRHPDHKWLSVLCNGNLVKL